MRAKFRIAGVILEAKVKVKETYYAVHNVNLAHRSINLILVFLLVSLSAVGN